MNPLNLTDAEIDALEAGEELDRLITQFVLTSSQFPYGQFSTLTAAALTVVEAMANHGFWMRLTSPYYPGALWFAEFTPHHTSGWNGRPDHESGAEMLELAICKAALKAVAGIQKQKQYEGEEKLFGG